MNLRYAAARPATPSPPLAAMPYVAEANRRIAELTGARFGRSYLDLVADGRFEMDSTAAAIGFAALRAQAPGSALPLAETMQEAFYRAGDSLSDPATYLRIAEQHELDADRVISDLADPRTRAVALRDFGRAAEVDRDGGASHWPAPTALRTVSRPT
ncbi:hypothetical protein ACQP2U_19280 [Nocardia sp. CA-084685]|uniref:hypothetical protein n=1 Tax=Nocardia sp. CA-084685 TaxID=3239970 RepID=UPI003D99E608